MSALCCRHLLPIVIPASALAWLAESDAYAQSSASHRATAQALFQKGEELMKQGNYAEACPKLQSVVQLFPGKIGAKLELAKCYKGAGKLASAWATFLEAMEHANRAKDAREKDARDQAKQIEPALSRLTIVVTPDPPAGLRIHRDGDDALIVSAQWGQAVPIDPGTYRIEATAPGKKPWSQTVDIREEGKTVTVTIPALEDAPQPTTPTAPAGVTPETPTPSPRAGADRAASATAARAQTLAHDRQIGAFLRSDIDGQLRGVVAAAGLSYGLGDHLELAAAGLIGRDKGIWAGATGYLLRGAFKPMLTAGMHLFFADNVRPGIHGAAGLQWDANRHFGAFVTGGFSYIPNVPANYDKLVFLPALGVQGRL